MAIVSFNFFVFCAAVLILYYIFPSKKYQWTVLLAASYAYYIICCNKYTFYLIATTAMAWVGGLIMDRLTVNCAAAVERNKEQWDKEQRKKYKAKVQSGRRAVMAAVLVLNFGILAFLKYFDFAARSVHSLLGAVGLDIAMPDFKLVLPLGISFYTFQTMGYVIDVYRGKFRAAKNPAKFALFASFFPQIVQGPIAFYSDLAYQLYAPHDFNYNRFKSGGILALWGLFKKLVIADRAVAMVKLVAGNYSDFKGTYILMAVCMYAIQLYADFSGGIDICRGFAEMLGITMAQNFRQPYFSRSLTEYWHRWHITLGEWLRTYLFYPISISKPFLKMGKQLKKHGLKHLGKVLPTSIASLITFIVIGVWHGAAWKYVAFGLFNGMAILISSLMQPWTQKLAKALRIRRENFFYRLFEIGRTMLLVLAGYYFDIAPGFKAAMKMMLRSVTDIHLSDLSDFACLAPSKLDRLDYLVIIFGSLVMLIVSIVREHTGRDVRQQLMRKPTIVQWPIYIALIMLIAVLGVYGPGCDPADFVYMQF